MNRIKINLPMENDQFSPKDSLALISSVIEEARYRIQENGVVYMFWGALIFLVSFLHFVLLQMGHYEMSYYPYFILPLGYIYTFMHYKKKAGKIKSPNRFSKILSGLWLTLGINLMLLGFIFPVILRENLIPIILIISSIGVCVSGVVLSERNILIAGILGNVLGFACFFVEYPFQPLFMAITALAAFFLPGYWLSRRHKKSVAKAV